MNRLRLMLLASLLSCHCAFAGDASNKISAKEADKFYEKTMTVTGKVAEVKFGPKAVHIYLDEADPKSPLTGVIFSAYTNNFTDLAKLKGKHVEITGKIVSNQGKP